MACVGWVFDLISHPLEEMAKLIHQRRLLGCADRGILMVDELPMFQHYARFELHYGKGCREHAGGVLAAGQLFRVALFLTKKISCLHSLLQCTVRCVLLAGPCYCDPRCSRARCYMGAAVGCVGCTLGTDGPIFTLGTDGQNKTASRLSCFPR